MENPGSSTSRFRLQATDALLLAILGVFTVLTVLFRQQVPNWGALVAKNLTVALAYVVLAALANRVPWRPARFVLRMLPVAMTCGYLFEAVDKLQLILTGGWMDDWVLRIEKALLGVQPTLWLEDFTVPWLTEWMMFAYLFYFIMYPLVAGIIFFREGGREMERFLFALALTNVLCDLGFILFPVAGPSATILDQFTVPLDGYVCTHLGELVRTRLQFPGGSIPSPHCAAATIMWLATFRRHRRVFWLVMPAVLSLYVSTFYCRYHYMSDAVVGIATAVLALVIAPKLMALWEGRGNQRPEVFR